MDWTYAQYLVVGASAYDPVLLPASALRLKHGSGGSWTLTITAPPTRTGATVVQVVVDDGYQNAGTAFVLTIALPATPAPSPRQASNVTATSSGSGIVLTWRPPVDGIQPPRYAIAGGTTSGGTDLPVVVTPDATPSFTIPMVPPGTYYFRVYSVFTDGVSAASDEVSVAASGSASASGPPSGLRASINGNDVTLQWQAPAFGAAPTLYEVEVGTAAGQRNLAILPAVTPTFTARGVDAGVYFTRVHAFTGGTIGAESNEVAVSVNPGRCAAPPSAPVFLPPSMTNGVMTFSWLPLSTVVDNYWVEILPASGGVSSISVNGTGTSLVWEPTVPSGSARVVATNPCGGSPRSNEMPFVVPR